MSWSFYATGKPKAVIAKAATEFGRIAEYVADPAERLIAALAYTAIRTALEEMPEASAVGVKSSGSRSAATDGNGAFNTFNLSVEPIYGFVE
jgi:hypothetical protein